WRGEAETGQGYETWSSEDRCRSPASPLPELPMLHCRARTGHPAPTQRHWRRRPACCLEEWWRPKIETLDASPFRQSLYNEKGHQVRGEAPTGVCRISTTYPGMQQHLSSLPF